MATVSASDLILYRTEDGHSCVEVRLEDGGELAENRTFKDFLIVAREGAREVRRHVKHYRLEAIIAVGYRVRSRCGTQFRQWATERLQEYLIKGFAMDDARLKAGTNIGSDWRAKLDAFLQLNDRDVLQSAGRVSKAVAHQLAREQYDMSHGQRLADEHRRAELAHDEELRALEKQLEKGTRRDD